MTITVTAIVATFNRARWLAESLDSLLAQTRPIDEIIVIDDGSTDTTDAVCARYGDRIRTIRLLENAGKPAALNMALTLARGSHIWIFDDDDVALPDALDKHIEYLTNHPAIDFSYADKYVVADVDDIWARAHWRIDRLDDLTPDKFFIRTLYTMNAMLPAMLIPKYAFERAAGFDETLDRCEDHDVLLRLAFYCRGGYAGHAAFVYRHHGALRGSKAQSHAARERFRVMLGYRQTVFRRIRQQMPLRAFAIVADGERAPASDWRALARLQCGCVMLHHGLINEALSDFTNAVARIDPADYTHPAVRNTLSRATQVEAWTWPRGVAELNRFAQLIATTKTSALAHSLTRGLYWQARAELRAGKRLEAARTLARISAFVAQCRYHRARVRPRAARRHQKPNRLS